MYEPFLEDIASFSMTFLGTRKSAALAFLDGTTRADRKCPEEPRDFELPELEREEC